MTNALAELDAADVALYSDQQAIDSTAPMGRAMIQMASVFGEPEREIIRSRVIAGLNRVRQQGKKLGRRRGRRRPRTPSGASERREWHPQGGGNGWRRKRHCAASEREMVGELDEAALPLWDRQPQHAGVSRPQ